MSRPIAVVDIDDTIADATNLMIQCLSNYTGVHVSKNDITEYDIASHFGISGEEFYKYLDKDGVIDDLAVLPGARKALERLSNDHEIVLVTARHRFREPLARTLKWVKSRNLPVDRVLVSGHPLRGLKSNVAYDQVCEHGVRVFFDDGMHNVWDMYDSGMSEVIYIPHQPWNASSHLDDDIYRCSSFRECVSFYYADYVEGR